MLNPRLSLLPGHTWTQLRALLDPHTPGSNAPVDLTIGAPKHAMPNFVKEVLAREEEGYHRYPPNFGTPDWQAAVTGWLEKRYGLNGIDGDKQIAPVNGTREGLFTMAFVAVPPEKDGRQPAVLMPNPFYQCYAAAALSAGAEPVYVPATAETGFLPDFLSLPENLLARTALIYLCSPANPQGVVADEDYLTALIRMCRAHDITLVVDECYAEIYTQAPPIGALEASRKLAEQETEAGDAHSDEAYKNVIAFHSLSKRSNVPGLRSGFAAGDASLMAAFRELRAYGGAPSPLPVYAAAAACWSDEAHVENSRDLYRRKFDAAEQILAGQFGFFRPEGGFYLWLDVEDGEAAALKLWKEAGVRVLPGAYLARVDSEGYNPGARYIRVALVDAPEITEEALMRLKSTLEQG